MMPGDLVKLPARLKDALGKVPDEKASLDIIQWATGAQLLVKADDAEEIRELEAFLGCTREEAVNHFVEDSCCSDDLPEYGGGRGTSKERLAALRKLWRTYERARVEDGHG